MAAQVLMRCCKKFVQSGQVFFLLRTMCCQIQAALNQLNQLTHQQAF